MQDTQTRSKMCYCNLHILIGNPTTLACFFYTKIDSAVPYNSAVHWGMLDIQYIAIRAPKKIQIKSE